MGQGINILVLSNRKIWCDSLVSSEGRSTDKISFFKQENLFDEGDRINIILIDAYGHSRVTVKKIIEKYWNYPVFIICAEKKKKNFDKAQNIMAVFSEGVTGHHIIQTITMALGDSKEKVFDKDILSVAEGLVLDGVTKGYSNKQIARRYNINLSTVKYHLQRLYQKLGVNNRVQAALIANEIIV